MKLKAATLSVTLALGLPAASVPSNGQQPAKIYRVGVVLQGGPYYDAVAGLRDGLKGVGFEEGRQYRLDIRDV